MNGSEFADLAVGTVLKYFHKGCYCAATVVKVDGNDITLRYTNLPAVRERTWKKSHIKKYYWL
jgi:hypothetical protein